MLKSKHQILQNTFGFDEFPLLQEAVDEKILEALQVLRREIAKEEGMPAYIIFDNKALTEMAHFFV
ncbi:HRDC domain-containing protein [Candidatus Ruthia endofausta]|uniref:HRDC domain-containing protein n=1 Tax=Candidatus Ruthia endofausta TaxID=2738852 RepID=A0A6N0HPL9_9GAMM|nr:HRDC domain-containing protein [Candidatus Ruthia endofausta]QKQ24318.1 HRDC domain-containing protein [Candidatus Ruthia endofausta]